MIFARILLVFALAVPGIAQQPPVAPYQPKFAGDKAQSNAEAAALGYMRTVLSAQKIYRTRHGNYAGTLSALVGSGSFTRRMQVTDRGDYTVSLRPKAEGYSLTLSPKQFDREHRAFYVDQSGTFRTEENKPATQSSPVLR